MVGAGTLLLGDWGPHWYVGDGDVWTRIVLPDPEPHEDFFLEARGERIPPTHPSFPLARIRPMIGNNRPSATVEPTEQS